MGEVLFRGIQLEGIWKWVYGNCIKALDGKSYIVTLWDNVGTWKDSPRLLYAEVDSSTVGQFTGLVDKNGTRIFSGDVVEICGNGKWLVDFTKGRFWINEDNISDGLGEYEQNEIEVVGNIYDNSELLEAIT